jgi:hypothetical protein
MSQKTEQLDSLYTETSKSQLNETENTSVRSLPVTKDGEIPFTNYSLILGQLQRLDVSIHKEYTLVSDRMSWMVTSESFIFTAFIVAVVNYKSELLLKFLARCFLILMPILGIFLAAIVTFAINAAHSAANRLKDDRDELEEKLPAMLRIKPISSKDPENNAGNLPPTYVPFVIIGIWTILLLVTVITVFFRR